MLAPVSESNERAVYESMIQVWYSYQSYNLQLNWVVLVATIPSPIHPPTRGLSSERKQACLPVVFEGTIAALQSSWHHCLELVSSFGLVWFTCVKEAYCCPAFLLREGDVTASVIWNSFMWAYICRRLHYLLWDTCANKEPKPELPLSTYQPLHCTKPANFSPFVVFLEVLANIDACTQSLPIHTFPCSVSPVVWMDGDSDGVNWGVHGYAYLFGQLCVSTNSSNQRVYQSINQLGWRVQGCQAALDGYTTSLEEDRRLASTCVPGSRLHKAVLVRMNSRLQPALWWVQFFSWRGYLRHTINIHIAVGMCKKKLY